MDSDFIIGLLHFQTANFRTVNRNLPLGLLPQKQRRLLSRLCNVYNEWIMQGSKYNGTYAV